MNDVLVKTAINLGLVVVGAVVAWYVPVLMLRVCWAAWCWAS